MELHSIFLWVWLLSLHTLFSRFIHVASCSVARNFCCVIFLCVTLLHKVCPFSGGWLFGLFPVLSYYEEICYKQYIHTCCEIRFHFFCVGDLLSHRVGVVFQRVCVTCILTSSVWTYKDGPDHSDKLPLLLMWEKVMATHSSTLGWKIPWTEEPGGLQSMGSQSDTTEVT